MTRHTNIGFYIITYCHLSYSYQAIASTAVVTYRVSLTAQLSPIPASCLTHDLRPDPPPPCPFTCATTPLRLRSAPPLPIFDCLTPLQPLSSFACPLSSPPKPFLRLHQSDSLPCVGVQKQAGNPAARAQAQICSARWGRRGFPPFKCA